MNTGREVLQWIYVGKMDFLQAMTVQSALHQRLVSDPEYADTVIFVEHNPTISCGRHADMAHVLLDAQQLTENNIQLHHIDRGGDVTFHGPGQLVCYPVRRVASRVKHHVEGVTSVLRSYLLDRGVVSEWSDDNPGLWTDRGKIAALGMRIREGVSVHGFALNIDIDLDAFNCIVPCGLKKPVDRLVDYPGNNTLSKKDFLDISREIAVGISAHFSYKELHQLHQLPHECWT